MRSCIADQRLKTVRTVHLQAHNGERRSGVLGAENLIVAIGVGDSEPDYEIRTQEGGFAFSGCAKIIASTSAMVPRSTTTLPFTYASPNRSSGSKNTLCSAHRDLKQIATGVPDRSPNDRVAPSEVVICRSPTQINRRRMFSKIRFKADIQQAQNPYRDTQPSDRGYVLDMRSSFFQRSRL